MNCNPIKWQTPTAQFFAFVLSVFVDARFEDFNILKLFLNYIMMLAFMIKSVPKYSIFSLIRIVIILNGAGFMLIPWSLVLIQFVINIFESLLLEIILLVLFNLV